MQTEFVNKYSVTRLDTDQALLQINDQKYILDFDHLFDLLMQLASVTSSIEQGMNDCCVHNRSHTAIKVH